MMQKTFRLVTFGDWELNYQLPIESKQKDLDMSPYMREFVNLLQLMLEVYGPQTTAMINSPTDVSKLFGIAQTEQGRKPLLLVTFNCEVMVQFFRDYLCSEYNQPLLSR